MFLHDKVFTIPDKLTEVYGKKVGLKIEKKANVWECQMEKQTLFEIHQQSGNSFKTLAELHTPTGHFVKCTDSPQLGLIDINGNALQVGGLSMIGNVFNLFKDGDGQGMQMKIDLSPDNFVVYADPNQLVSVFNNLLKNGIQAIPDGREGKITVVLFQEEEMVCVKVTDNGVGISDDKKDKVFVPNFTTKSSGTGLGLAISKNIVESVNGEIFFHTVADVGTSFFVRLPIIRSGELEDAH